MPSLEIKNLSVELGGNQILKNINIKFDQRKVYGIIGPNGSGKTTLLNTIYKGRGNRDMVLVNDRDIKTLSSIEIAREIAFMNQMNEGLQAELTLEDLVMMGRYPYKKRFEEYNDQDASIVNQYLNYMGIMDIRQRTVSSVSGGERQRALVAKALAQETDIILLDEPTNHIDIRYQIELMQKLRSINKLVILTIHDVALASRYCDEIIVLKKGQIIKTGGPRQVLTRELLTDVYQTKFKVLYEPEFIIYY